MEKLDIGQPAKENGLEPAIFGQQKVHKALSKGLMNNAGIYISIFIVFAVIVVVTTEIRVTSFQDMAALGLDFFLLLFCSQSMYINCADSGTRHGKQSKIYRDADARFEEAKASVSEARYYGRLYEFCQKYVFDELRAARTAVLMSRGISYKRYCLLFINKKESQIDRAPDLSPAQIEAVKKANRMRPANLTPEMIMRRGSGYHRSLPLGIRPETKKRINFAVKFCKTFLLSFAISTIVLDVIAKPSWVLFASVCLKLLSVVLSGFGGYKFGYENVVVDTVGYLSAQADLMDQAKKYIDTNAPKNDLYEAETRVTFETEYDKAVLENPETYWLCAK